MKYVVHPGNGKLTPSASVTYIDAGTLASLYGLQPGDYILSNDFAPDAIHLVPRSDGNYQPIKRELADNGTDFHQDYPAFMHTTHNGRYKSTRQIQPQYKATFRDRRRRETDKYI
jgi:hypothetical protein